MKKLCTSLREHATNLVNFEKNKIITLTKKAQITPICSRMLHLWKKIIKKCLLMIIIIERLLGHCHFTGKNRGAGHNICNLKFNILNDIPVFFHSGLTVIIILSWKNQQMSLSDNLNVSGKTQQSTKLFLFQQKKKLQILIKMVMKVLPVYLTK